jgi:PAS domain S-box-containing protein
LQYANLHEMSVSVMNLKYSESSILDSGWAVTIVETIPWPLCVLSSTGELLYANSFGKEFYARLTRENRPQAFISEFDEVLQREKTLLGHPLTLDGKRFAVTATPIRMASAEPALLTAFVEVSLYKPLFNDEFQKYQTIIEDLQIIFENSYDVLYVSDGQGRTLRASSACEFLWGKKPEELVGRTVYELEQEGVYRPSATRLALEHGKKVQIVQQTRTGRRLMVVSTPIRDVNGNIVRVVNASRDITEIHELEQEIAQLKSLTEGYRKQLAEVQQSKARRENCLIYSSKVMADLVTTLVKIASVDSTVLITGESGVGKEVVANYIHQVGEKADQPIIKVNCAAIPESLLESELFGYEEGAFTGASKRGKAGLFELANGGTLFLDEIGDMPLSLQAKLLRVLQDGEIMRIGGRKPIEVNVRIIAATNQDMEQRVKEGLFRKDLFYRLNVIPITIPPLRERPEDILPLIQHFLSMFNERFGKQVSLTSSAIHLLEMYPWPGNVRELQNVIERLVVTADTQQVGPDELPATIRGALDTPGEIGNLFANGGVVISTLIPLKDAVEQVESQLLLMASQRCRTLAEIADLLQVNQSTISRKLQKYRLDISGATSTRYRFNK